MPTIAIGSGHWFNGFSDEMFSRSGTERKVAEVLGSGVIEIGAILIDRVGGPMGGW